MLLSAMRLITAEEHFQLPAIREAAERALGSRGRYMAAERGDRLEDLDAGRLEAMDAGGINMQVLSHTYPGVEVLDPTEAVPLAREANDVLADATKRWSSESALHLRRDHRRQPPVVGVAELTFLVEGAAHGAAQALGSAAIIDVDK